MQYSGKLKTASEKEISALLKELQKAGEHSSAMVIQWKEHSDALESKVEV